MNRSLRLVYQCWLPPHHQLCGFQWSLRPIYFHLYSPWATQFQKVVFQRESAKLLPLFRLITTCKNHPFECNPLSKMLQEGMSHYSVHIRFEILPFFLQLGDVKFNFKNGVRRLDFRSPNGRSFKRRANFYSDLFFPLESDLCLPNPFYRAFVQMIICFNTEIYKDKRDRVDA